MIVFNLYAALCGLVGVVLSVVFGGSIIAFAIDAGATDIVIRFVDANRRGDGISLFRPSAGGALFWIFPVWAVSGALFVVGLVASVGGGDEAEREEAARVAAAAAIQYPDDSHLIAPPPPPVPKTILRIETNPPGADVRLNAAHVGSTPIRAKVPAGSDSEVVVKKDGYVPVTRTVPVGATTATVTIELVKGVPIRVSSEPERATIEIDGKPIGDTPQDELVVPARKRFTMKVKKPGYRTWKKRIKRPRKNKRFAVRLKPLPLSKLELSPDEKEELRDIRQSIAQAKTELAAAQRNAAKAKAAVARASGHYDRIDATNAFEDAQAELEARKADFDDANSQVDAFRARVVSRVSDD